MDKIILLALVFCFFALLFFFAFRRQRLLKHLAREFNFTYKKQDPSVLQVLSGSRLISISKGKQDVHNILQGNLANLKIWITDYFCTTIDENSLQQNLNLSDLGKIANSFLNPTVCVIQVPSVQWPSFAVWPKQNEDRWAPIYGKPTSLFPEDHEFSEQYFISLYSAEPNLVKTWISPAVRTWLLENKSKKLSVEEMEEMQQKGVDLSKSEKNRRHLHFELWEDKLLFHREKIIKLNEIEEFLKLVLELVNLLRALPPKS